MFGRQNHLKPLAPLALRTMIFSSGASGGNLKKVWPYIPWQRGVASSIKLQCKNCSTNFPRYFFRTFIQSCVETPKTLQKSFSVIVVCRRLCSLETSRRKTISLNFGDLHVTEKVIQISSVQFRWEDICLYLSNFWRNVLQQQRAREKIKQIKVLLKGYIKYFFWPLRNSKLCSWGLL